MTEMKAFIARYQSDKAAGELVVQALLRASPQAQQGAEQPREYDAALQRRRRRLRALRPGAGLVSPPSTRRRRSSSVVDKVGRDVRELRDHAGQAGHARRLREERRRADRGAAAARPRPRPRPTTSIPPYRRPTWTIAAFVRQGRIYEVLARAVLNTPFVVPADLQKQDARAARRSSQDEIKIQVEDAIRQLLDSQGAADRVPRGRRATRSPRAPPAPAASTTSTRARPSTASTPTATSASPSASPRWRPRTRRSRPISPASSSAPR